ncbi:hypothetical protein DAETH_48290 (plasmid) [Deinococcus aetherius]|uniref:Uncharacterized protein n=1 Tax=Deinococcus aetherius TaxID=200252 RepID=A0ABM8ALZ2_9DEIO|nr:hypothetical protein [Deinococcus aetherius]BDP44860.1 hypothetical protein DAETH_48290 [Deinococcus aetherius]
MTEPYLEILEDEVLNARSARELLSRVEDYPAGSERFERVQAQLLADLAGLALQDLDLDDVDDPPR